MDIKKLKEYIEIAKEAVKNESEPYKTEGYKIILEKLLNSSDTTPVYHDKKSHNDSVNVMADRDIEESKKYLAKQCGLSLDELNHVLSIGTNHEIEINVPLSGTDARKHIIVTLCVLAASEFLLGKEWLESPKIAECLRAAGVKDLANLSYTLKRYSTLIRMKGTRGIHKQYRLTTNEGRTKAFDVINKLAKRVEVSV